MLIATYSLVAISTEQTLMRRSLDRLKHILTVGVRKVQPLDASVIAEVLSHLQRFDQHFHSRRLEAVMIPAIRGVTAEVDDLIDDLNATSALASRHLSTLQHPARSALSRDTLEANGVCRVIEQYCDQLQDRLRMEEEHLFPLITHLLSNEQWFEIGAQLLSEDGDRYSHRRPTIPMPQYVAATG